LSRYPESQFGLQRWVASPWNGQLPIKQAHRTSFSTSPAMVTFWEIAPDRAFRCEFARLARRRVVSIDCSLATENPFPASLEDTVTAYSALLGQGVGSQDIALFHAMPPTGAQALDTFAKFETDQWKMG
jgi:hypothetical protein